MTLGPEVVGILGGQRSRHAAGQVRFKPEHFGCKIAVGEILLVGEYRKP